MTRLSYPVRMEADDNDTYLVTFVDFKEGATFGATRKEALAHAVSALETLIIGRMLDKEDIPRASPAKGRPTVTLPPMSAAKAALYMAMRDVGMRKATLARKLGWSPTQVDRLLDLRHNSRLDQLEAAFEVLGKVIEISVKEAA